MASVRRCPGWVASGALCLALAACGAFFENDTVAESEAAQGQDSAVALLTGLSLIAGDIGGAGSVNAGIATNARFYSPAAIAADGSGNLYVADTYNFTIRKITPAGVVITLAGTAGSSGSADGTGAAARFGEIYGITTDVSGNVYVADSINHTIRQITPAGVVTTLAGTPGSLGSTDGTGAAARFNFPIGVTTDGAGNLHVVDSDNHTIRQIVIATGAVTTLAGTAGSNGSTDGTGAAARFRWPGGMVSDGAGNLYLADTANFTIRKIVIATGVVTTLAGTAASFGSADGVGAAALFYGPSGITADGLGNLYVSDINHNTIRQIVIATAVVTTLAGTAGSNGSADGTGAAAQFESPYSIAADPTGNVYVADTDNNTIRKIVPATGVVTTFAGAVERFGSADGTVAAARFLDLRGISADASGNLYAADSNNNTIRQISPAGVVTTLAGTAGVSGSADGTGAAAQFDFPYGITTDVSGNLYVADTSNHVIRKIVIATGEVTTLAGTAGSNGSTDATGAAARFWFPRSITADGAGNLFVADTSNQMIRKIVIATGVVTTLAGSAGGFGSTDATGAAAQFQNPFGITADGAGNLYVADSGNKTVRKIVIATAVVTTLAGTAGSSGNADGTGAAAQFVFPANLTADALGNVYVTEFNTHTVRKIETATGVVTTPVGVAGQKGVLLGDLPGSLTSPYGITSLDARTLALTTAQGVVKVELP
ncbi:MAG: NHL repeat-containing protein [Pseudomonadota bacterium]